MLRHMLLAASGSDRARQLISSAPLARGVVARYVAGESAADAVAVSRDLIDAGLLVTLDYLGEDTTDPDQAAAVTAEYCGLLRQLATAGLSRGGRAEVSVKPTAVGLQLPEHGRKTATENIARICAAARDAGTTVTVDAEEHTTAEATQAIVAEPAAGLPRPRLRDPVVAAPGGRRTARRWPAPARGCGCARAPTTRRPRPPSPAGPRWTAATPGACGR